MDFKLNPIGIVHSPFKEKFGTPRQPGLITDVASSIEMLPPYDTQEAFDGIDQFSHLWICFIFHKNKDKPWTPRVRPPRLGGNKSIGVFASRAPYRPNPIGISVVEFAGIRKHNNKLFLDIKGADIIDGTPVMDIKPYLPYSDSIPGASAGYAERSPEAKLKVEFSEQVQQQLLQFSEKYPKLETLIKQVIALDPRPAYSSNDERGKKYGIELLEFNVQWQVAKGIAEVVALEQNN